VDGSLTTVGWSNWTAYTNWIHNAINSRRAIASPCTIRVETSLNGTTVNATVWVVAEQAMQNSDQRLYVALIHRCHNYGGTRWWIFRDFQPNSSGYSFLLNAGDSLGYGTSFTTGSGWDLNDLRVVAFVQRYNTKEVLQSGFAEVGEFPSLVINEFMAYNVSAVQDPQGEYDDWVELFNPGTRTMNMLGKALTNQCSDPDKWSFPDTTVPPGGHLVVWCDGETADPGLHANFTLNQTVDTLVLYDNLATCYEEIDRVIYPAQTQDISYGRLCDGDSYWVQFPESTPGTENSGCVGVQSLSAVVEGPDLHLFWKPLYLMANYVIYRHDEYPFDPSEGDAIGSVSDTSYVDPGVLSTVPTAYYRIVASPR
jgi:hypothetical protein